MYLFRHIHWIHGQEGWLMSKNTFCTKTRTWVQIPNSCKKPGMATYLLTTIVLSGKKDRRMAGTC